MTNMPRRRELVVLLFIEKSPFTLKALCSTAQGCPTKLGYPGIKPINHQNPEGVPQRSTVCATPSGLCASLHNNPGLCCLTPSGYFHRADCILSRPISSLKHSIQEPPSMLLRICLLFSVVVSLSIVASAPFAADKDKADAVPKVKVTKSDFEAMMKSISNWGRWGAA